VGSTLPGGVASTLRDNPEVLYGAILALVIVALLTPAVGGMARLLGVVDRPDGRRLNRRPIPRLGGLALFFGIMVPSLAFLDLTGETRGLLLGAAVATTVGAIDDFRGLTWWQKLGGQGLAAAITVGAGVWVTRFTFPVIGVHELPDWVGMPLSWLWIVAIMNMFNFLDGLDGLAAGIAAISGATFAILALDLGKTQPAILAAIVLGASLGFLRHNFYPARIFMGDSGALLLGFTLAAVSIQGLLKTAAAVTLFLPLIALAIPILDTSFVVAKRLKYRRPVYEADRTHFHHRFVNIGFSQRRAALTMYAWCVTLAAAALTIAFVHPRPHGDWRPWPTLVDSLVGLLAIAATVYVVYLLEIVKLANPLIRRREDEARAGARRSA
jgi:UDP-GlcNAc:undecaprenyl-phosphate GlcNAc-1-phosphate transferase